MRSILKLSLFTGFAFGTPTYYNNHYRPAPPDPKLHEKKNKKIVVVGAGIVGLSTAYYLS